ncbi:hypothetical protein AB7W88_18635 [Providencia vermicola]|uniref:Uncharacterized protein n=2 Tax=Providencia TaxID=586 RepID=A0AAI9HYP1_PROST|nr:MULTISPECIES: hypothetical protein [Providencia]ELR5044012.1 hypothetical protein [Providencia rettgeri]MTB42061.1 hypothetical protein [Providencia sp. wls1949]MTC06533.1 hypothetical protein [Providencia sp. wls1948]WBA55713.1 hypothetical protein O7C57_12685 [Providencia sp. 21OH12SH02B-Prov]ELR5035263.1 hypothetical protein [Providencia stuartii]
MKKYLLPISLFINLVLLIAIIVMATLFFNLKGKIDTTVAQIKNGQYAELIKDNTAKLIPEGLKRIDTIQPGQSQCAYFYQNIDSITEYLTANPTIAGAETYIKQLNNLKKSAEKAPSALKETACEKGVSTINYISEKISTVTD